MYQVKSLTGTAVGSTNVLCFPVCCEERKCKPGWGLQLIIAPVSAGWQLVCVWGNSCTGTEQWYWSGWWWRQPSGPPSLFSAPWWFVSYSLPYRGISWVSAAYGFTEDTTTFSFTPPLQLSHWNSTSERIWWWTWGPLHPASCPSTRRKLLTHTRHSAATLLTGSQGGITGNACPICTDIYRGYLSLLWKPAEETGYAHVKLLLVWNCEEWTEFLMGLSL